MVEPGGCRQMLEMAGLTPMVASLATVAGAERRRTKGGGRPNAGLFDRSLNQDLRTRGLL